MYFAYKRIPVVDTRMTIKVLTPIINMFKTELHACKQQHTPTAN